MARIDYRTTHVTIERMSDKDFENIAVQYCIVDSCFGPMAVAFTHKGICAMEFIDGPAEAVEVLRRRFPSADIRASCSEYMCMDEVRLHIHGTEFQHRVWRALLTIPYGKVATYGDIARVIGCPEAVRAVGSAIGRNPVALLIPCHRVVRSGGGLGGYYWSVDRKRIILEHERCCIDSSNGSR